MSSSIWKTLFDQVSEVMDLVKEGKRDPKKVSIILQSIIGSRSEIFTLFSKFNLQPVLEHNTKDCFQSTGSIKSWRDRKLDSWTSQQRKAHEGGDYIANSITERVDSRMMAKNILGINKYDKISRVKLQQQLIDKGHCVEMQQIDQEIRRLEDGAEDSPLAKDGRGTFFFVDNYDGTVSVVGVSWDFGSGWWYSHIFKFDSDSLWSIEDRVVSRSKRLRAKKEMFEYVKYS